MIEFPNIIGQEKVKGTLNFYLDGYHGTTGPGSNIMPNALFIAQKGQGKTYIATELAKKLTYKTEAGDKKIKKLITLNCASPTVKKVKNFFEQVIIPHVVDKHVTILLDEASELSSETTNALLTILNPTRENRTSFSYDSYNVDFDWRMHTFLFASSEPQAVFHALRDRLTIIALEEYKREDLATIIQKALPDVVFDDGVLEEMATVVRSNARQAQRMANNVNTLLSAKGAEDNYCFYKSDWEKLRRQLDILPLGLNQLELQVLQYLKRVGESSLTGLSAATGLTTNALRQDIEHYPIKQGLMTIREQSRRSLTGAGHEYLAKLYA